jgi:hypothetical protein
MSPVELSPFVGKLIELIAARANAEPDVWVQELILDWFRVALEDDPDGELRAIERKALEYANAWQAVAEQMTRGAMNA